MNQIAKTTIFPVLLAAVMLSLPLSAQAFKVGVVDLQRVLLESQRGQVAKDLLSSTTQSKKEELEKYSNEFKRRQEGLERKVAVLSLEAKEKMVRELQEMQMQLQQMYQQFRTDIQQQDADLTQAILKDLEPILKNLATKESFDLVLEKTESGILYTPEKTDLTDRVIKLYDARKRK